MMPQHNNAHPSSGFVQRLTPQLDWRVLATAHPNVMLTVAADSADDAVAALTPYLRQPIHSVSGWTRSEAPCEGTLVLRDVDALSAEQQRDLLEWSTDLGARVQMISLASQPLFPRVMSGDFLDGLYYHLNMLYFFTSAAESWSETRPLAALQ